MNKLFRSAGLFLLIAVLVFSLAACGLPFNTTPTAEPVVEPSKEVVVETPPPSPTPTPTPTPSVTVPPVAVTTVPMPMPSVSPTVAVTNEPIPTDASGNPVASADPTVSPSPSASPSPTPTPYSYDAAFASTIMPDSVTIPENATEGHLNANGVNLRGGPSASARVLGTYDSGTRVSVIGSENGWTEVIINGNVGYVRSDYVSAGYVGSNAASAGINSSAVMIGDGSSSGLVIVPDGHISSGNGSVVTPQETYFLGIMPD